MQFQRAKQFRLRYEQRYTKTVSADADDDNPELVYKLLDYNAILRNITNPAAGNTLPVLGTTQADPNCVGFQEFAKQVNNYRYAKIDSINVVAQCTGVQLPAGQYRRDKQLEQVMFLQTSSKKWTDTLAAAKTQAGSPYDLMKANEKTVKKSVFVQKNPTGMKYHNSSQIVTYLDGNAAMTNGIRVPAGGVSTTNWNATTAYTGTTQDTTFNIPKVVAQSDNTAANLWYYSLDQYKNNGPPNVHQNMIRDKYYCTSQTNSTFSALSQYADNCNFPRAIYWSPSITNAAMDRIFNFKVTTWVIISAKDWFPYTGYTLPVPSIMPASEEQSDDVTEPAVKRVKHEKEIHF